MFGFQISLECLSATCVSLNLSCLITLNSIICVLQLVVCVHVFLDLSAAGLCISFSFKFFSNIYKVSGVPNQVSSVANALLGCPSPPPSNIIVSLEFG